MKEAGNTKQEEEKMANTITQKQKDFIRTLLAEREGNEDAETLRRILNTCQEAGSLNKATASAAIDSLLKLPKTRGAAPREELPDVEAGHYAVLSRTGNNDLDFFRVDRPSEGDWAGYTFVKRVIGGRPDHPVRGREAVEALKAIAEAGPAEAQRLYGQELGRCGRCNRHLTDEESRSRGIGPDCAQLIGVA